jgi:hypothetical protein
MALPELTPQLALLEEAVIVLFCRIDDTYYHLNPKGRHYETLAGLATRIAAKMTACTYAFLVNRTLGRPQGRFKELWA